MSGTRGSIRNRGDHRWQITYELQKTPQGSRKQGYETVQGTKRDAQRRLNEILAEIQAGKYIEPSKLLVSVFYHRWIGAIGPSLAKKTLDEYKKMGDNHIIPYFGNMLMCNVEPLSIQEYYNYLGEKGRIKKTLKPRKEGAPPHKIMPDGLSPLTIRHHHTLLHKMFADAVHWKKIPFNPFDFVKPPKVEKTKMKVLSKEEVKDLCDHFMSNKYYIAIVLAISTGMRRGEILALKWDDVDLESQKPHVIVRQSLQQTNGRVISFKETKTGKIRKIPISRKTVNELIKHRSKQAENKLLLGAEYEDNDLVCCQPDGKMIIPDILSNVFEAHINRMKITQVRFHDLRHTYVSLLIAQGEHMKVISELLGHSSISITMDRYGHLLPTLADAVAERFDEALGW
ncbi:MAG: site-specific integrase [Armatimonadota bacterium]